MTVNQFLIENQSLTHAQAASALDGLGFHAVHKDYIRKQRYSLRKQGLIDSFEEVSKLQQKDTGFREETKESLRVEGKSRKEITSLEEAVEFFKVDTNIWEPEKFSCRAWSMGYKNANNQGQAMPLYSIGVTFKRRKAVHDAKIILSAMLEEYKVQTPVKFQLDTPTQRMNEKFLAVYSLFDAHFGKLCWAPESGENYDLNIAEDRYNAAFQELVSDAYKFPITRNLIIFGQDMLHINGLNSTTFAGTQMDADVRYPKVFMRVFNLCKQKVSELLSLGSPVDVLMSPGNHDLEATFHLGVALEAWFHGNPNVTIMNQPSLRKYYQYGQTLFGITHGSEEKLADLDRVMSTEQRVLWGQTRFHEILTGHFHKRKATTTVTIDEEHGTITRTLPSISGTDAWHSKNGMTMNEKQAIALVYSYERGIKAEYIYKDLRVNS